MQKKLIALAIAGMAGMVAAPVAMAQSNVTVYGIVDVFGGTIGGDVLNSAGEVESGRRNGIDSGGLSGSRIGFRGQEDLGNGLKAVFTLEYGINVDQNTGIGSDGLKARQQFVGLNGGWGTVVAGRLYSPGFGWAAKYDSIAGSSLGGFAVLTSAQNATLNAGGAARVENAIGYASPNWNGFTVNAAYAFGEENDTEGNDETGVFGIGADYTNGPLAIGVVYHQLFEKATARNFASDAESDGQTEWGIGASYDFGFMKAFGRFQQIDADSTVAGISDYSADMWALGAEVPVGPAGKVHLSYGNLSGDDQPGVDNNIDTYTLMYTHAMSKRTTLYGGYTGVDFDDGALWVEGNNQLVASQQGLSVISGEKYDAFFLGVRHSF